LKVQASCGQKDPRKLDRKAAVIMAQLRCKTFDTKFKRQVWGQRSGQPGSSNICFVPESRCKLFRHRLSTSTKLPFYEAEKEKKKGKGKLTNIY
jgi:hypothetical protein